MTSSARLWIEGFNNQFVMTTSEIALSRWSVPNFLISYPILHAHAVIVSRSKPSTIASDCRVPGVEIVEGDAVLSRNVVAAVARLRLVKENTATRYPRLDGRGCGHGPCARGARLDRGHRRCRSNRAGARKWDTGDAVGNVQLEDGAVGVNVRVERDELSHSDVVLCLNGIACAAAADSVPLVAEGRGARHGLRWRDHPGRGGNGDRCDGYAGYICSVDGSDTKRLSEFSKESCKEGRINTRHQV